MSIFQEGDVVRLKSGGPNMTVTGIVQKNDIQSLEGNDTGKISCQWFSNEGMLQEGRFKESLIVKID